MTPRQQSIVNAGLQILDQYGLADLSMRRVADAVGIQAASIYWHFPNKQTLLAAISDKILGELTPASEISSWAWQLRTVLLAHRDAAELVSSSLALGLGKVDLEADAQRVIQLQGLTATRQLARVFIHFVLGHVFEEQSRQQLAELGVLPAGQRELDPQGFQLGLRVLETGVEVLQENKNPCE